MRASAIFIFCAGLVGAATLASSAAPGSSARPDPVESHALLILDDYLAGRPASENLGMIAQTLALLGREDLVMRPPFSHGRRNCVPMADNGTPVDPVTYIADRASRFRVTMINEAHDLPQNRAFIAKVAAALRPLDYRFYGAETFNYSIGGNKPAWPLLTDGYYVQEPVYGRLVRTLRTLGYQLFPYEYRTQPDANLSPEDNVANREQGEAENLASEVGRVPQTSKVIVHVGYSHLDKSEVVPIEMMAARFRTLTGIDPLTVDQTSFWSATGAYSICDGSRIHVSDPSVIYVGMAKPNFARNRPSWRLNAGDQFVPIPQSLRLPNEAAIYEARAIGEPDDAVPMDRLLVRPGEDLPLLLPPGRYSVADWTEKRGWSATVEIVDVIRAI